jgi:hypothetical protein
MATPVDFEPTNVSLKSKFAAVKLRDMGFNCIAVPLARPPDPPVQPQAYYASGAVSFLDADHLPTLPELFNAWMYARSQVSEFGVQYEQWLNHRSRCNGIGYLRERWSNVCD